MLGINLKLFGLNLYYLIGLLFFLSPAIPLLILIIAMIRSRIHRAKVDRAERQRRADLLGPDGRPLPPTAPGLCDDCSIVYGDVYHLPDGRRLCKYCYHAPGPTGPDSPQSA
jgi:hypothetical protein